VKKEVKIWGIAAAGLALLSLMLPWIEVLGTSQNAISWDGKWAILTLVLMAAFVIDMVYAPQYLATRVFALINGALGAFGAGYVHISVSDAREEGGEFAQALISVGFGAYLCLLASLALIVWAVKTHLDARKAKRSVLVDGTWVRQSEAG
jgi:hypothetical protein